MSGDGPRFVRRRAGGGPAGGAPAGGAPAGGAPAGGASAGGGRAAEGPPGRGPDATADQAPGGRLETAAFRQYLVEAGLRFATLREGADEGLDAGRVLSELDVAWEELHAADEELGVQARALDEAAGKVERERLRYRELFDFSPDPYVVTDDYGKIVTANRASAVLFNVPAYKLPGRFLISFVQLAERSAFRERLNAMLRERRALRWDATLRPPSARDEPPEVAVAVTAAPGREGGVLWAIRDVSEKRRQEAELRALNEGLERRVLERTRELEALRCSLEEMLARERDARQRASRERGEFLALLSHELRSPLNAMLGWVELADEDDPGARRRALEVIERNGRVVASLVDDLLDVTRIDRGEFVLAKARLGLGELLANLCDALWLGAQSREVSLSFEAEGGFVAPIEGDRRRLEQAFGNLIVNAVKFTPAGGAVRVRLWREGKGVTVRVADTGQGIAPSLLPHVFERYHQGEGGPQGRRRGLGLGLAIVWQVVTLHGGSVRAESQGEGYGATFTVRLPLAEETEAQLAR